MKKKTPNQRGKRVIMGKLKGGIQSIGTRKRSGETPEERPANSLQRCEKKGRKEINKSTHLSNIERSSKEGKRTGLDGESINGRKNNERRTTATKKE